VLIGEREGSQASSDFVCLRCQLTQVRKFNAHEVAYMTLRVQSAAPTFLLGLGREEELHRAYFPLYPFDAAFSSTLAIADECKVERVFECKVSRCLI
jgi:hypothetical protein